MSSSLLRTDLINDSTLLEEPNRIKVIAEEHFNLIITQAEQVQNRQASLYAAKDIIEVMDLIRQIILDYEDRTKVSEDGKINVVYEKPDVELEAETIAINFRDRVPGAFSQGAPKEGKVRNRRPILVDYLDDPDNPGYKRGVLLYFYDNTIRLTAWARTNKQANARAIWLENLIEEYTWFLTLSGVGRIFFEGWGPNETIEINGNRYYGRPIDYFVRTQKRWNISQKTLEEIYIRLAISST